MRIEIPGGTIELTTEQLKQAHDEYVEWVKQETAREKYKSFVVNFCLNHSPTLISWDACRRNELFRETYGFYPEEGCGNASDPHYILGAIYADHEQKMQWYSDDDMAWNDAIDNIMSEAEETKKLEVGNFADYVRCQYTLDINSLRMIDDACAYAKRTFATDEAVKAFLHTICGSVLETSDIDRVVLSY